MQNFRAWFVNLLSLYAFTASSKIHNLSPIEGQNIPSNSYNIWASKGLYKMYIRPGIEPDISYSYSCIKAEE